MTRAAAGTNTDRIVPAAVLFSFYQIYVIIKSRVCLKNHCAVLNAPLCGILRRNFGRAAPLCSQNRSLSPVNWSIQPGASIFQTQSNVKTSIRQNISRSQIVKQYKSINKDCRMINQKNTAGGEYGRIFTFI